MYTKETEKNVKLTKSSYINSKNDNNRLDQITQNHGTSSSSEQNLKNVNSNSNNNEINSNKKTSNNTESSNECKKQGNLIVQNENNYITKVYVIADEHNTKNTNNHNSNDIVREISTEKGKIKSQFIKKTLTVIIIRT